MPTGRRSAKFEFFLKKILCRVPSCRHSAKFEFFLFKKFFAECPLAGTRQSLNFFLKKIRCQVPYGRHSAKFEFFFKYSLPSVMVTALDKARKMGARKTIFPALSSAMTMALGKEFFFKKNQTLPSASQRALGKEI